MVTSQTIYELRERPYLKYKVQVIEENTVYSFHMCTHVHIQLPSVQNNLLPGRYHTSWAVQLWLSQASLRVTPSVAPENTQFVPTMAT